MNNSVNILKMLHMSKPKKNLKEATSSGEPMVYMNTWGNYNIYGADLEQYGIKDGWMSIDDAIEFCKKYAEDEPFINDTDNFPIEVGEYDSAPSVLQKVKDFMERDEDERKVILNILEALSTDDLDEAIEVYDNDAYTFIPDIENDSDLGYWCVEEFGIEGLTNADAYFDRDEYVRTVKMEWDDTEERERYAEDNGIDIDDIDEDEFDSYMDEYIEEIVDETEIPTETLQQYFDFEALGRDLGFDGYTFTADGVVRLD